MERLAGVTVSGDIDGNNRLLRKYVHQPDKPAKSEARSTKSETNSKHEWAMIETGAPTGPTVWDFEFASLGFVSSFEIRISDLSPSDGLGSVIALSDAAGEAAVLYEYSIYGQVASSDPNHPNPFLFTGREFDKETGLYYYRARYYNATIGRFLQTDPIGYGDGMNMYRYCGNSPLHFVDTMGLSPDPISIAVFDGGEDIGTKFAQAANDMDEYFDMNECSMGMTITAWIEQKLLELKDTLGSDWDHVAGIYFMDHSTGPVDSPIVTELSFGRE
jgi:RHS repeat-associated protein